MRSPGDCVLSQRLIPDPLVGARSAVVGAMGPERIPFNDGDDADAFVGEYGGEAMAAEGVERSTLGSL